MEKTRQRNRIGVLLVLSAMAIASMLVLASCSAPADSTSSSAADSSASSSASTSASSSVVATSSSASSEAISSSSEAAATSEEAAVQSGTVTTTIDMSSYGAGEVVRVWVPMPTSGDYQTISNEEINAEGGATTETTEDSLGNKMAYIEWGADADPASRKATVSFHAKREEALRPTFNEDTSGGAIPADIADNYLGSSTMVQADDPEVIALAEEITAGKTTLLDKARAVYDWIYDNMERDNDVIGCGDGDVCRLITEDQRAGKCTDINSVFVALCRASGVPAREMFGIRMNDADITGNQHCWCEFYLPGTGWVPADPADVLKAVLNDKLDKTSDEALEKKEYYWGQWDEKRVEYSHGRDLTLSPAQNGGPLNDFGYPYAEVNEEVIDFYKPDAFVYSIAFEEDAAADASSGGITVDTAAKSVSFTATATGYDGESSIHFLVNEKGSNAGQAHFTTAVTSRELFDALESIGAEHGDNIKVEDSSGTIEGSDLKVTINVDGTDYIPSELVEGDQARTSQPRFGGNIDANEEYATGCLFCLESCSLGITSDAAYQYTEPETFTPTSNMPAKGTEVTVTMAL